jgi:hypothetical protein
MHIDPASGKILGAMESPGHWLNVSSIGEIYVGSLTGSVFRWYPGRIEHGLGGEEGLRPANGGGDGALRFVQSNLATAAIAAARALLAKVIGARVLRAGDADIGRGLFADVAGKWHGAG